MNSPQPTPMEIIEDVAAETHVAAKYILGRKRLKSVARARHIAMKRIHDRCFFSQTEVAQIFKCDYTTVGYALRNCEKKGWS